MFARLKLSAISGFILLHYVLKNNKTSENSAKKGAYLNAYFDIFEPWVLFY